MGLWSTLKSLAGIEEKKEVDYAALRVAIDARDRDAMHTALNGNPWENVYQDMMGGKIKGFKHSDANTLYQGLSGAQMPAKPADHERQQISGDGINADIKQKLAEEAARKRQEILGAGPGGTRTGISRDGKK